MNYWGVCNPDFSPPMNVGRAGIDAEERPLAALVPTGILVPRSIDGHGVEVAPTLARQCKIVTLKGAFKTLGEDIPTGIDAVGHVASVEIAPLQSRTAKLQARGVVTGVADGQRNIPGDTECVFGGAGGTCAQDHQNETQQEQLGQ